MRGIAVMKRVLWWFCFAMVGWITPLVWADSPLTSTPFYRAYLDIPAVQLAAQTKQASGLVLEFLLQKHPLDQKAAVINALGWSIKGQSNGLRYATALAQVYRSTLEQLDARSLSASELAVLGYLLAMDDYLGLKPLRPGSRGLLGMSPLTLLFSASVKDHTNFTAVLLYGLVRAQEVMPRSWCQVYTLVDKALKHFSPDKRNLRPAAVQIITKYIGLYRRSCEPPPPAKDPRFNMVYRVVRYRHWVVTGTQAGIAFFHATSGQVEYLHPAPICNALVVAGPHLWAGTYDTLIRFDGTRAQEMLRFKPGRGLDVWHTPQKQIVARKGRQYWYYNTTSQKMVLLSQAQRVALGLDRTGDDYNLTFVPGGGVWSVQFMSGILHHTPQQTQRYPVRSQSFPGRDPRRIIYTTNGQLLVADFSDGFFFYYPKQDSFVAFPFVTTKGSDAAIDAGRKRLWLLHYTQGLYMKEPKHPVRYFDLRHLQYLRSMYLEPDGKTLWIGGWKHLVQMKETQPGTWSFRSFVSGRP